LPISGGSSSRRYQGPLFFVISAAIIVTISLIFKTKSAQMFGYLILAAIIVYLITGLVQAKGLSQPLKD
jgi:CDP-diacylglycerol--serine O-phosphatidyltransferase